MREREITNKDVKEYVAWSIWSDKKGVPKLLIFGKDEYKSMETLPDSRSIIMRNAKDLKQKRQTLEDAFGPKLLAEITQLIASGNVVELNTIAYQLILDWIHWRDAPNDNRMVH